jgi:hypothetical protein
LGLITETKERLGPANPIYGELIYMSGCTEGWLAVFDRRPDVKWEDKIYMKKETVEGKTITIVGL